MTGRRCGRLSILWKFRIEPGLGQCRCVDEEGLLWIGPARCFGLDSPHHTCRSPFGYINPDLA